MESLQHFNSILGSGLKIGEARQARLGSSLVFCKIVALNFES
ncbi:unnamed protein product [Rhodiola kirilowii]